MFLQKVDKLLRKFLLIFHIHGYGGTKDYYISKVSQDAPWVYIAYISAIFYHKDDELQRNSHQSNNEALAQVEVFNELGYNVYVQQYFSKREIPSMKFDIIFGHEPNFVRAVEKNPKALKVHYVPGAYIDHRNGQIIRMTDNFNQTYNSSIPYRRLLEYDNPNHSSKIAYEVADKILMIGSKFTIDTFPVHLHSKIVTIHQSTQLVHKVKNIDYATPNEFFFMGSGGNILKGISLLVEYFSKHPEFIINIVGPIENDVRDALHNIITDNIIFHGYVDVNSEGMINIVKRCNFIIYPSGSEGMPGAVLNSMKNGLIPIVTRWAAFDEIDKYGYVLEDWSVNAIDKGIKWSHSLSQNDILRLKRSCSLYIENTYNINRYKKEFKDFFVQNIDKFNK